MYSLNRAQVIGNVTRDPEIRFIPSGQAVTNFSVATNRRWNDKDGNAQEDTQFHEIVVWGKPAEIISQMVKKGNKIYIEGRLQTRSWDAPDGSKRQRTEIVTENFVILTPKPAGSTSGSAFESMSSEASKAPSAPVKGKTEAPATSNDDVINLDDIPF